MSVIERESAMIVGGRSKSKLSSVVDKDGCVHALLSS